jgi:nucleoside-diphosphate-sugar epimerase
VNALNLPYTEWERGLFALAETAIAASRAAGATLVFPGNLYGYGAGMPAMLDETTPMRPTARKGALRLAIENRLREEAEQGLRVIVLRAGDFYGGGATGSWFDRFVAKDISQGRVGYPGPLDVVHEWAYLPDLVGALVRVAAVRDTLPGFAELGFAGHAVTGRELIGTIAQTTGRRLRVSHMPWWLLRLLSPVVPIFRELSETAYLWSTPHRIDGTRLAAVIGEMPRTPFADAIAIALRELLSA